MGPPVAKNKKLSGLILYLVVLVGYIIALKASAEIGQGKSRGEVHAHLRELAKFRWYFFTLWNFAAQIFFLLTAILDELAKILEAPVGIQKRLSRTRAFSFNTFVFPCSLLVMTVFWSLWHIDRELIFPKIIDEVYPVWLNHTLHTFIAVPLIIELLLPKTYNFVQFKTAARTLLIYCTVYQILYFSIYVRHGVWLYPIYKWLNWTQRIIFTILQALISLIYLKIGVVIQNRKKLRRKVKIY